MIIRCIQSMNRNNFVLISKTHNIMLCVLLLNETF